MQLLIEFQVLQKLKKMHAQCVSIEKSHADKGHINEINAWPKAYGVHKSPSLKKLLTVNVVRHTNEMCFSRNEVSEVACDDIGFQIDSNCERN